MKRIILILLAAAGSLVVPGCKEMENDGKTLIVQDSLATVFPTYQSVKILIDEDRSHMKLVIGDVTFYSASPEEKAKKAREYGLLVERIYGKGNLLKRGEVVVTKDPRNTEMEPKDGVSTPIPFDELKK